MEQSVPAPRLDNLDAFNDISFINDHYSYIYIGYMYVLVGKVYHQDENGEVEEKSHS